MSASVSNMMERHALEVMIGEDRILTIEQMEGEKIHKIWIRFKGLITQCPNHCLADLILTDCFYQCLTTRTKRPVDNLISGGLAKKPSTTTIQLLDNVAKINLEVEQDFI